MTGRPDGCPLSVLQVLGRGIKEIPPQKKNFDLGGSNFWTDSPSELALMSFTPSIRHSFAWGVNTPWILGVELGGLDLTMCALIECAAEHKRSQRVVLI
jgi:hypothetical protein